MDDRALVAGLTDRNDAAEEEFVAKYRPRILFALAEFGVAEAEQEDVAQEVLLTAWRNLVAGKFQHRSELFTWLHTLIKGKAIDHCRRPENRQAGRRDSIDAHPRLCDALASTAEHADPETLLMTQRALEALPLRERLMFEMRYRHGLEVTEIASRFRLSEQRVRNLLSEAKRKFVNAVRGNQPDSKRLTGQKRD